MVVGLNQRTPIDGYPACGMGRAVRHCGAAACLPQAAADDRNLCLRHSPSRGKYALCRGRPYCISSRPRRVSTATQSELHAVRFSTRRSRAGPDQSRSVLVNLEFRQADVPESVTTTLRAATGKDLAFATDVMSGRVKIQESVHEGRVVGDCVGNSATGEILDLSVDHAYRCQGTARKLLSLVVDLMRADGVQTIWLAALTDPTSSAYLFYRAVGWRPTGEQLTDLEEILELPFID
jgi:ribosomal protein S18 acetylase RimI-like enzyme